MKGLLIAAAVAVALSGSGAESMREPDVAPVQGEGQEGRPQQLCWAESCAINPWIAQPPYPPSEGSQWCWREIAELV